MSFSLTGPLTFLTMVLEVSSKNSTLTWVTPPLEPVLPNTLITLAKVTGVLVSMLSIEVVEKFYHFLTEALWCAHAHKPQVCKW